MKVDFCSNDSAKSELLHHGVVDNHSRYRTAVFLLFRRVNAMGPHVHRKAMHLPLNGKILELAKVIGVVLLKHRNGAAGTGGRRQSLSQARGFSRSAEGA